MNFADWWNEIGSGITPVDGDDYEEHARKVAEVSWFAAVEACAQRAEEVAASLSHGEVLANIRRAVLNA